VIFPIVGRRFLQFLPVVIGVTFITFLLLNLLPGDTAVAILGTSATPASIALLRRQLGLNEPLLVRYWHWLTHALSGNLGHSLITQQPVTTVLAQRVPVTLELLILAFLIALVFAVPVAVLAARQPKGIIDRLSATAAMFGLAIPNFVLGLVLILLFAQHFHFFPATGFSALGSGLGPNLRSLLLPALTISFALFAAYSRMLRADMMQQLAQEEYVITARAKGVGEPRILIRHVLRNSLFSLITIVGVNFGTLIGATVIVESIFALPGIGSLLVSAVYNRDVTVTQGVVVILAVVTVTVNLVTDLLYLVLDPRVRYGSL